MHPRNHYLAFDRAFFIRHQRTLLRLLNAPIIGGWFRWVLRVNGARSAIGTRPIVQIDPYAIFWVETRLSRRPVQMSAEFRTHPKFGKRLYYAFRPLWWLLHAWDFIIADRLLHQLSFGFSTLTAQPASGTGGSTFDGEDYNITSGPTYASNHDNAFDSGRNATNASGLACANSFLGSGPQFTISRGVYWFDTSGLGATAVISAAILSLFGLGAVNNADTDSVSVVTFTGTVVGFNGDQRDFSRTGAATSPTKFATDLLFSSWSTSAYNDLTLNANGISAISLTAISKFCTRTAKDCSKTQPGGQNDVTCYFADQAGTSNDPKLVVTYTVPTNYTSNLTESVPITATILNQTGRVLAETSSVVDTILKKGAKVLSESIPITATLTALRAVFKQLADSFSLADTLIKFTSRVLSDSPTVTDSLLKTSSRVLTDSAPVTASVAKLPGRSLSEAGALVDSIVRTTSRLLSDPSSVTDAISKVSARALSDSTPVTDNLRKIPGRSLSELSVHTDGLVRSTARTLSDSPGVTDVLVKTSTRPLSESAPVTDAISKLPARSLAESPSVADSLQKASSRSLTESPGVTDILLKVASRSLSEAFAVADTLKRLFGRALSEKISLTDRLRSLLNGLDARFSSKYPHAAASYTGKYPKKGASYDKKYP